MRKILLKYVLLFLSLLCLEYFVLLSFCSDKDTEQDTAVIIVDRIHKLEKDKQLLKVYIQTIMDDVSLKLGTISKEIIADAIIRVTIKVFPDLDQRLDYVTIVAIESGFNQEARSSKGAIGLAQVLPKYAKEFLSYCNASLYSEKELELAEINLLAGACFYRELIKRTGSTKLALAAYNAGLNSGTVRSLLHLQADGNKETAWYLAKHSYLLERTLSKINTLGE